MGSSAHQFIERHWFEVFIMLWMAVDQFWIQAVVPVNLLQLREKFAVILAWNSFFHLPQADQRHMFAMFRAHAELPADPH